MQSLDRTLQLHTVYVIMLLTYTFPTINEQLIHQSNPNGQHEWAKTEPPFLIISAYSLGFHQHLFGR